jgi:adenylosuccinate lyase
MITAISPLDGRYNTKVKAYEDYFSEYALIKYRTTVEIEWFIHISKYLQDFGELRSEQTAELRSIYENFTTADAETVKRTEQITNHDVKAVEYFIKDKLKASGHFTQQLEFVHFACTSEDINNLSYALMIRDALRGELEPKLEALLHRIVELAKNYKAVPMLSRTHGQTASPTTVGKEFVNVAYRFKRKIDGLKQVPILGTINGAVGNFNAHLSAYPELDWLSISESFVTQTLKLDYNLLTTQIEPHDFVAELSHKMKEINTILIDFDRDIWAYISLGFFKQKLKAGEIGSSTMPHKVNPIDFENSEGNAGMANALLNHFAEKLPISRMQRDLTDSTVFRNVGMGFAYSSLAIDSCIKGLGKLELNKARLNEDLENAWEVLAEPIQTVMRRYKIENAYEKLKELTRGQNISAQTIRSFVDSLDLPDEEKKRMKAWTPQNYIGDAIRLLDTALARFFT